MLPTPRRMAFSNATAYTGLPGRAAGHLVAVRVPLAWYNFCETRYVPTTQMIPPPNVTQWQPAVVPVTGLYDRLLVRPAGGVAPCQVRVGVYYPHRTNPLDSQEKAVGLPTGAPIIEAVQDTVGNVDPAPYVFPNPFQWSAGQLLWLWIASDTNNRATLHISQGYCLPSLTLPAGYPGSVMNWIRNPEVPVRAAGGVCPNLGAGAYNVYSVGNSNSWTYTVVFRLLS